LSRLTHANELEGIQTVPISRPYAEKADSIHELIYMDDGTELKGKYFDGEWVSMRDGTRYWDSEYVHSLVFDYGNFHVGIRAPRQKVSFEELFRIAGSFAHS